MGFFTFIKVMMILFNLAIFVSAGAVPTRGHPLSAVPPGWAVGLGSTLSLGAVGSLAPVVCSKPLVGGGTGDSGCCIDPTGPFPVPGGVLGAPGSHPLGSPRL